jgi:hypothetical protein
MRKLILLLLPAAMLSLGSCCQEPAATKIIYTGVDILRDSIEAPGGSYISFTVPMAATRREEDGKKKPGVCYTKILSFEFINPFDTARFKAMLNKPLQLKGGAVIPAYRNLLKLNPPGFDIIYQYFNLSGNYPERIILHADSSLIKWPTGNVRFIFEGSTVRNETFSDSADIFVR